MIVAVPTKRALQLFLHGSRALSQVEATGIRVDVGYLDTTILEVENELDDKLRAMRDSKVGLIWQKRFPAAFNLMSRPQLGVVLAKEMGFDLPRTAKGNISTTEALLDQIDDPFVKRYLDYMHLAKVLSTYLHGIRRETVDGFIHPFFNLHKVKTYRSSSEAINFQNIPIRVEKMMRLIRRAFIPRKGNVLVEGDYSGIEVRVAACYTHDPTLIRYIKDPTSDLHRDMASECFMLPASQVTSDIRYVAKNRFVFPQFYGDYYLSCAKHLWKAAVEGTDLEEHLRQHGITSRGACVADQRPSPNTFEHHIQQVERDFWQKRFKVYAEWKKRWYADYLRRGFIQMLTGFVCRGEMNRKEAINYPFQGSAFHCLLRSVAQLVLNELPTRKMKAVVVGQIHDSILGDVPEREVEDYKALVEDVMVRQLMGVWKWIIVPLAVEFDCYPESWAQAVKE